MERLKKEISNNQEMDTLAEYGYLFGTTGAVTSVDLDNLTQSDTLEGLDMRVQDGIIAVPKIVGVLQVVEPVFTTEVEKLHRERIESNFRRGYKSNLHTATMQLRSRYGIQDEISPGLIHIGYDPSIFPKDLIRASIGDHFGRVALSPIGELPNFNQKNFSLAEEAYFLSEQNAVEGVKVEETAEKIRPMLTELKRQARIYGLTRKEFFLLTEIEELATEGPRIIKPYEFKREGIVVIEPSN